MISRKMQSLVSNSSAIRAMFEEGRKMAAEFGAENVYDFSLGNPCVAAPEAVGEAIIDLVKTTDPLELHGYMSNAGYEDVREAVAQSLNKRFGTAFGAHNILMTVGAAGGLNVILKTLLNPGDEVMAFAPFFSEYRNYTENHGGVLTVVPADTEHFQLNLAAAADVITEKTRAVILNNPNNPSGVIYGEETIQQLAALLEEKSKQYGAPIYLISDEPYRELAYDGAQVPYLTKYYKNTVVGYSWSKSLSLPGERIGYLVMPDELDGAEEIQSAAVTANRMLGFVNAPSLIQKAVARCLDAKVDLDFYDRNRKALSEGLAERGFEFVPPQGAFYLLLKSPVPDEKEFVQNAKKYHILMVSAASFACPGYVRLAYCTSPQTIAGSMDGFAKLAAEYGLK